MTLRFLRFALLGSSKSESFQHHYRYRKNFTEKSCCWGAEGKQKHDVKIKSVKASLVPKTTTGTAGLGETTPEPSLLGQLHKEVPSLQNYDSETVEKLVKSSATYIFAFSSLVLLFVALCNLLELFDYLVSLLNNRKQINFKSNYLKQHPYSK